MSAYDIIVANLEHDNPPRPGLTFSGDRINDMVTAGVTSSKTYEPKRWTEGNIEYYDDAWGNVWYRDVEGSAGGEVYKPAIEDWSELDELQVPDFDDPDRYVRAAEVFGKNDGKFKAGFVPGWVFATSRYLRKMEIYFMDLIEYREEIDQLHNLVTDVYVKVIHRFADAGVDAIFYCEDLGTQDRALIGPEMWCDVFKPHYERLVGAAHERDVRVLMHSCGYNWELLDDLIEVGIDCFQFDQPEAYDMPALAEKLREARVGLWSPLDIQCVLPTGDRSYIENEAHKMVDLFNGGLILKNYGDLQGIGVEPEWDMWGYEAILEACGLGPAQ
ncbi:MAG: hypothetical protein KGZ25_13550 [Planctomycetes bacterium]|nr:hypothetical protein [Planctomycetota bacterium]